MISYLAQLFLAFVLVVAWQPASASVRLPGTPTPQEVARAQERGHQDHSPEIYKHTRALVEQVIRVVVWFWNALNDNVGVVTLLFTGALVLFTSRLARVTGDVADAAKESAEVAKSSLRDLERTFVTVEVTKPGLKVDSNGRFRAAGERLKYRCVNYGRSPVHLTEIYTDFPVPDTGQLPDPVTHDFGQSRQLPAGIIAARGAPYEEIEKPMTIFDGRMYEADAYDKYRFFFIGCITYLDTFGDLSICGFCFEFDPFGGRWVRVGDGQYNYTKAYEHPDEEPVDPPG